MCNFVAINSALKLFQIHFLNTPTFCAQWGTNVYKIYNHALESINWVLEMQIPSIFSIGELMLNDFEIFKYRPAVSYEIINW